MGHQLKSIDLGNGHIEKEEACMNYKCRCCGVQASACNYVLGVCLQVYAPHLPGCKEYVENEKKAGYVTNCSTCIYHTDEGCISADDRS